MSDSKIKQIKELANLKNELEELEQYRFAFVNATDYGTIDIRAITESNPFSSTGSDSKHIEEVFKPEHPLKKEITKLLIKHLDDEIERVKTELDKYEISKH